MGNIIISFRFLGWIMSTSTSISTDPVRMSPHTGSTASINVDQAPPRAIRVRLPGGGAILFLEAGTGRRSLIIPTDLAAAQAKSLALFRPPPAARNPFPSRRSSRFAPKARRRVVEFYLPVRSWHVPFSMAFSRWVRGPRPSTSPGPQRTIWRPWRS